MGIERRIMIGQHFVCGFEGTGMDDSFIEAVRRYKIGNVILFSRNIASKEQLYKLCFDIQELVQHECGHPALITIDQEGGMVTRLSGDCTNVPSAMAIAATGEEKSAFDAGLLTATELRALGVNVDFAPCLDVNSNSHNPVIGVRSYGDRSEVVSSYGLSMIDGLQSGGVMAVAKHFPGHGDTHLDSHVALPVVEGTKEELAMHLAPFRSAVAGGVMGIMTSHILFPQLEKNNVPATMSRSIITDFLRSELGFKGLIFSDCMEMDAIAKHYGTVKGAVAALKAGVDLVCISHHVCLGCEAVEAVEAALDAGVLSEADLKQSTHNILMAKSMLAEEQRPPLSVVDCPEHRAMNQKLHRQSLTLVQDVPFALGDNPCFVGPKCFRATNVSSDEEALVFAPYMAALLGGSSIVTDENPGNEEIERVGGQTSSSSSVVCATYNGHLHPGQVQLVNSLAKKKPVLCIALRNPYDLALLDARIRSIAAYAYTKPVLAAFAKYVQEPFPLEGRLTVSLGGSHA